MARMRVVPHGDVANLVIERKDGHELSLSSRGGSLVEFKGSEMVTDYGSFHFDADVVLDIVREFLASEVER